MTRNHTSPPPASDQRHHRQPDQRQQALQLVTQLRLANGRRYGAATAAARILGIDPALVQKWVRATRPPPQPPAGTHPLTGLLHCPSCQQAMRPTHTTAGLRAYQCATSCRPDGGVNADRIEHLVGTGLLWQAPNALRRHLRATTPQQAAAAAATLLGRISIGRDGQPHLTWRPTGHTHLARPELNGDTLHAHRPS